MVEPLQTGTPVSPTDIDHLVYGGLVVTGEEGQEELVAGVQRPVELRVDIVEVQGVVLIVVRQLQEHIHVGASGGHQERGLVLDDRTFDGPFGGEQTDGGTTVPAVLVACSSRDVEHGRRGAAVLGGQQSFVECAGCQGIVVEGGEETAHMSYVVDGGVVEQHLVLCRRAASYLEAAGGIALGLDTGQQLDGAHDIVLAKQLRRRCQVLQLQHLGTRLHVLYALPG